MKGTVQASLMPYDALANWKLAEVSKYIITAPVVSTTTHYVIMNEKTWNSLPKEVQDIINEINLETIDFAAPLFDDMAAGGIAYAEEQKAEIYELDAAVLTEMSTMMNSVVTDYLAEMTKAGLDGQLALDKVKELADKYNAQYGGAN
jgi:TRAP-type C4-dicarboxylate transport system substrate-binding protein